jgi:hypothetical protein
MAELGELIKKHINERMNNQEKQHVRRLEVMFQTQKERLERHKWIIDMKNEEINNLKKEIVALKLSCTCKDAEVEDLD